MMLRSGVRTCSTKHIKDAKTRINDLIYAGTHPIYQNIFFQESTDAIKMPPELQNVLIKHKTASRTGDIGQSQGGDAMLEEINKESKSWLKLSGVPSEEQWLRVFSNLDDLNKV